MAEREDVARIRTYLEEHRATYDRTALRTKLLEDGHDSEAVDLAIAQVYGFEVAPASPQPTTNPRNRVILIAIGVFLANYTLLPAAAVLALSLVDQSGSFGSVAGILGVVPMILLLEGVAVLGLRRGNPTLARGLGWGLLISLIPLVGLALLFGICLALISGIGG